LCLLALQMMFGAYVAGLDAGYAFNSWPRMGDHVFPPETAMLEPFLANLVDNPIVVQFIHRWLGIATLLSGVDIMIAVAHQAMAVLLLAALLITAHRLGERTT
jgi:heme a synthase